MARIRSIKPEFWTSEQIMECSPLARLLFIGMWNFADDHGRLRNSPRRLKAQVFPSDDITSDEIRGMIDELSSNKLILLYRAAEHDLIQITGWHHQKIDRPGKSMFPSHQEVEPSASPREPSQNDRRMIVEPSSNDRRALATEKEKEKEKEEDIVLRTLAPSLGSDEPPKAARPREEPKIEEPALTPAKAKRQPKAAKPPPNYHPDFIVLWDSFPRHPNSSKADAFVAWSCLTPEDRELCLDGALAYRKHLAKERERRRPDDQPYVKYLETFINKRSWEALLEAAE